MNDDPTTQQLPEPPHGIKLKIHWTHRESGAGGTAFAWFDGHTWRNWYGNFDLAEWDILLWEKLS